MIALAVIGAGAIGAVIRFLLSKAFARHTSLPWVVLVVNVVGSAIGGAVLGLATLGAASPELRLIVLTGLCGGLTTFSTLSVETVQLALDGKWRIAAVSMSANLVLGVASAAVAYSIVVR